MAKTKNRKPDFNVYMVSGGGKDRKGFWTKIGAAWRHEDGEGFNVSLEAFPTNGQLVIRAPKAKDDTEE
jgi:hypothetical protein